MKLKKAILLCAGKGTRLGELSHEVPKPLLPVCNVPILRYGIRSLVAQGVCDIVINLHHRGQLIRDELGDGTDLGARIQYSDEPEILGTGGGLKGALQLLDPSHSDDPFISLNGKLIFDLDIPALMAAYQSAPSSLGMMVVQSAPDALEWGAVDVQFGESSPRVHNILGAGQFMFCGVHVTRPSTVKRLPEGFSCMVRQGYLPWLQRGERVTAYVHRDGYFAEHSTPQRYLQSNFDLLRGSRLRYPPAGMSYSAPSSCTITEPVQLGRNVQIGRNCTLGPNLIVGDNVTIADDCHLDHCVIWSGSTVKDSQHNAIVTPQTILSAS